MDVSESNFNLAISNEFGILHYSSVSGDGEYEVYRLRDILRYISKYLVYLLLCLHKVLQGGGAGVSSLAYHG